MLDTLTNLNFQDPHAKSDETRQIKAEILEFWRACGVPVNINFGLLVERKEVTI